MRAPVDDVSDPSLAQPLETVEKRVLATAREA